MSADLPRSRRQLGHRDGQDIIFCHSCEHQWYRDSRDSSAPPPCPVCGNDIIETVSEDSDPREFRADVDPLQALLGMARPGNGRIHLQGPFDSHDLGHLHNDADDDGRPRFPSNSNDHMHHHLHYHSAGHPANTNDSDPEEADIGEVEEHETFGPNGIYMYRTVFQNGPSNSSGPRRTVSGRQVGGIDPSDPTNIITAFGDILNSFRTVQAGRSGRETLFGQDNRRGNLETFNLGSSSGATISGIPVRHVQQATFSGPRFRGGATSFTIATGPVRTGAGPPGDFNTIFTNIIGNVGPPSFGEEQERTADMPPAFPDALRDLLATLLGSREGGAFGDAVHSDEALDRIISMLMENNPSSNGAPPATQTALEQLERKKVDEKLLGPEGHAECTICISGVQLGEEVLCLPCRHWFHEECVVMWLKQHNTCPVCRQAVENNNSGARATATNGNSSGNSRPGNSNGSGSSNNGSGSNSSSSANANGNINGNASGGLFGMLGAFGGSPANASSSASPGTASFGLGGDRGGASSQNASNEASGAATSSAFRFPALPAAQRAQLEAARRRAGMSSSRYRSPRDSEQSSLDRRRRDSHSPNPGPPHLSNRRHIADQDAEDIYGASGVGREESPSSSHSRPWSTTSHNSGSSGQNPDQPRRAWDRNLDRNLDRSQYRERQRERQQERLWTSTSAQDQSRGSVYTAPSPGAAPPGRSTSWMQSRYMNIGGDGAYDSNASATAGIDPNLIGINASGGGSGSGAGTSSGNSTGNSIGNSVSASSNRSGQDSDIGVGTGTGTGYNTGSDAGSESATGNAVHTGSSGGLFGFLNRFRDSGNSQSSTSARRRP